MAIYNVRVKHGPFSGMAADGARLNILPGQYQVRENGPDLVFDGADTRNGGAIVVDLRDYREIGDFPDSIHPDAQIELLK